MIKLRRLFLLPRSGDLQRDVMTQILYNMLLALIVITIPVSIFYALTGRSVAALSIAVSTLPLLLCLWLTRRGQENLANPILLLSILVLATTLAYHGNGLQDIAILLYPFAILMASLLLKRPGYFLIIVLSIASLVSIVVGQLNGIITRVDKPDVFLIGDLIMGILILVIIATVIYLLAETTRQNLMQVQQNQLALAAVNEKMHQQIAERQHAEKVQNAIYRISEAAQTAQSLSELYISIHNIIRQLMAARNFYISLYDRKANLFTVPYLADELDAQWLPHQPGKSLDAYILHTGMPLLATPEILYALEKAGKVDIQERQMVDWLGVPLKTTRGIIGVMAVQTYKQGERLNDADKDVLVFVSTQVATAIERKQDEVERQNLITELENKNAELERFTYTVSHDLKSPLITIRGFADFLQRDLDADNMERVRQDVRRITQSAEKMQDLLNDLLELSRIGRLMNPPEAVPFDAVVHEALELVEGPLAAGGVEVSVTEQMPVVYGDQVRLVEVIQNLIENAIKFMGEQDKPHIAIGVEDSATKGMPVFFVRDNGIGIALQFHQKIFGLFEKLEPRSEGTGIGLALVKRIIEVHGGIIWVASSGTGQGTTFYFTLPTAQNKL